MAEILNKSNFDLPIPGSQLEAAKYNSNIGKLILAINKTYEGVTEANIQNVSKEMANQTELQAVDVDPIAPGTRYIVIDDTAVNGIGTGREYVTYVLSDRDTGTGVDKQWIVDSVGVPLATSNNDGLLTKDDFTKLRELSDNKYYQDNLDKLENLIKGNTSNILTMQQNIIDINTHLKNIDDNKQDKSLGDDSNFTSHTVEGRIQEAGDKIAVIEKDVADNKVSITNLESREPEIEKNKSDITKIQSDVAGLETDKQNIKLNYKQAEGKDVNTEDQIKANEQETIEAKTREDNFVKKDDGEMAPGYNASGNKEVIVKETFDDRKAAVEASLKDLNEKLAVKADVTDLGQKPLIYIPGQGASDTVIVNPVIPSVTGNTLTYTFDVTDWAAWKTRLDPDNKLLINGIQADIYIKDNTSTTYPGKESYNNGSSTKITFGTDADAQWSLDDGKLVIETNNQNANITRTLRQITFLVESAAGTSIDQGARDLIAKLQGETQKIAIDLIGITSKTVEGALTELKNRIDAVEAAIKGISYDEPSKTTSISDNLNVGETLDAKKITQGGVQVALKTEILDIIPVDENNNTVGEVRAAIKASLNSTAGRKSVIFNHADSTQKDETYIGYIEQITNDPAEGGVAYFGESGFNKFTTTDDGRPYIFQLMLNLEAWQAWQKTLDASDPRRIGTDSEIDSTKQLQLDGTHIFQARREVPLNINNENVLIDSIEEPSFDAMETLLKGAI